VEILKTKSKFLFTVVRSFHWGGYVTQPGMEIEIENSLAVELIKAGKLLPPPAPETGEYYCLTELVLPGREVKFKAKARESVILRRDQVLPLLLARQIIPADPDQWRPFNIKFSQDDRGVARLARHKREQSLAEMQGKK